MRVRVFGALRALVGAKEVEVGAAGTVRAVLAELAATYPALGERVLDEDGDLRGSILVLVNGRNIEFLGGVDTLLQKGDQVAVFPPVGGG